MGTGTGKIDNGDGSALPDGAPVMVVVDDHPLFRGALRQAFSNSARMLEADGFEALRTLLAGPDEVDLVLLDLSMPGMSGFTGLMALRAEYPGTPVVVVSASDDAQTVRRALTLGASGFISKSAGMETMREAVDAVLSGHVWEPVGSGEAVGDEDEVGDLVRRIGTLTPQQARVLAMLGQGLLNKQIAWELSVSEATVKAHVSAVLQKLDVASRTQAVIALGKLGTDALPEPKQD